MKKLLFFPLLLSVLFCSAQNSAVFCVQTNCPITIQLPLDSAQIFGSATITGDTVSAYQWSVVSGATGTATTGVTLPTATTVQTWAKGLTTAGTYIFSLTVKTKHGGVQTISNDVVTVLPAPPPPPTITSLSITIDNQSLPISPTGITVTLSNGQIIKQ